MRKLEGKTLIVLTCCVTKTGKWPYPTTVPAVPNAFITARGLINGQRPPQDVVTTPRENVDPTPAIWLYSGRLYCKLDKSDILAAMQDWLDIIILSGGYGMTHAYEPIVPYEAPMPDYFDAWIDAGLPNALKKYIGNTKPNNVIAFFADNANKPRSYGGMFCQGTDGISVGGILGKYVPAPMPGKANIRLSELVMDIVHTKTLIEVDDIPFKPPCWFSQKTASSHRPQQEIGDSMANRDIILNFLRANKGGCCDDCLSRETQILPRQQVNHICRILEGEGLITRSRGFCDCGCSDRQKIINRRP